MKNKFFARVLALCMAISLLSTSAFAASFTDLQGAIDGTAYESESGGIAVSTDETGNRTVTLNENVEGDGRAIVKNSNVTIDLNGNHITGTGTYVVGVAKDAELTVTDSSDAGTGAIVGNGTTTVINNQGMFELQSGTVQASQGYGILTTGDAAISKDGVVVVDRTSSGSDRGVNVSSGGSLETSGTISGGYIGIFVNNGNAVVNGGTVDENGAYGIYASGADAEVTVNGGEVTGNSSGMYLAKGVKATVNDGTIVGNGKSGAGVVLFGEGKTDPDEMTTLTVNGGTITGTNNIGIGGNGANDATTNNSGTVIDINGGTISADKIGIYHPQLGRMTINGGTVTGGWTGVEVRAGDVVINGGSIASNSKEFKVEPNANGSTTVGAGLAIAQHVTKQDISVTINGGTITGGKGIHESNPQGNDKVDEQVHPTVNGGKIVSVDTSVSADDVSYFVTGGMSTNEIALKYLGENAKCFAVDFNEDVLKDINGELHFLVGDQLTGTGTNPAPMEINDTVQLVPEYQLDGSVIPGTVTGVMLRVSEDSEETAKNAIITDWSSADETIAIVDKNGGVTAIGAGTVIITADLFNGETVTFTVTVTASEEPGEEDPAEPEEPGEEDPTEPEEPGVTIPDPDVPLFGAPEAADTATIEDEEVPLAGIVTLAELLEALRVREEIAEIELPEDFKWIDHIYAQAIYWGLEEQLVVDTEEDPLDPDEILTVELMQEVLDNFVDVYKGYEDFIVTVDGEADELVMDLIERLAAFYTELELYEAAGK